MDVHHAGVICMIASVEVYPLLEFLRSGGHFWIYSALLKLPLAIVMVYGTEKLGVKDTK